MKDKYSKLNKFCELLENYRWEVKMLATSDTGSYMHIETEDVELARQELIKYFVDNTKE